MSDVKVGRTAMKMVKIRSRDKVCQKCGARMVEEMAAPAKGQLRDEMKQGRFHQARVYCPSGCSAGWRQG